MAKPSKKPRFATGGGAIVTDVPAGKRDVGWTDGDPLEGPYLNDLLKNIYEWVNYLDGLNGEALSWSVLQTFAASLKTASSGPMVAHLQSDSKPPGAQLRFCLGEWSVHSSGNNKARLYLAEAGAGGQLELTVNAKWDTSNGTVGGPHWVADVGSGDAFLVSFDTQRIDVQSKVGVSVGTQWLPSAWTAGAGHIEAGTMTLDGALAAASATAATVVATTSMTAPTVLPTAAPAKTAASTNALVAPNVPKAWCSVVGTGSTGAQTFNDGFNVASVTADDTVAAVGSFVVTFAQPMANANYAVVVTTNGSATKPYVHTKATGSFRVSLASILGGASLVTADLGNHEIGVVVFGRQ